MEVSERGVTKGCPVLGPWPENPRGADEVDSNVTQS